MCPKLTSFPLEPSLESPSGTEEYPSPLHAVTLQSPVLLKGGAEAEKPTLLEGLGAPENGYDSLQTESGTPSYIDKLLQRRIHKETVKPEERFHPKFTANVPEVSQKCPSVLPPSRANTVPPIREEKGRRYSQEPMYKTNQKLSFGAPDGLSRYSGVTKDCRSDDVAWSSLKKTLKPPGEKAKIPRSCSDKKSHFEPLNLGITQSFGSPELVHAMFVPAGSQRRQADRRTKSMKLKSRSGGPKPRAAKHQYGFNAERSGVEAKWKGKATNRADAWPELRQRAGFTCTPSGPGLKVQPRIGSVPVFGKLGKSCGPQCLEYDPQAERRRRQAASKWQSDMDVSHAPYVQRSKESRLQAYESVQVVCSTKSGPWIGPQPFQVPVFSGSFLHTLNSSYPPAPARAPGPHPPRCESEYSAECPSLFHSTIAESSEGETSDATANRFGDGESSRSLRSCWDSDSSLSPEGEGEEHEEERGLVWAEASLGTAAASATRPLRLAPPRPEPTTCRIKASRALKKKIRRFQPASLKVMTLV